MINYTGINRLLNILPPIKIRCKHCQFKFVIKLGLIRYSRKNYDGPYCPKCGNKAMVKNQESRRVNNESQF